MDDNVLVEGAGNGAGTKASRVGKKAPTKKVAKKRGTFELGPRSRSSSNPTRKKVAQTTAPSAAKKASVAAKKAAPTKSNVRSAAAKKAAATRAAKKSPAKKTADQKFREANFGLSRREVERGQRRMGLR